MYKKLISSLLVFVMLFSILPIQSIAEEDVDPDSEEITQLEESSFEQESENDDYGDENLGQLLFKQKEGYLDETDKENYLNDDVNGNVFTSWDNVPEILLYGEYDFSDLPEEAGGLDGNKVLPKTITIDGAKVKVNNKNEKIFKYLQFNLKNGAELTINDMKIDNYPQASIGSNSAYKASSVKALDNTENKLIVEGAKNSLTGDKSGAGISVNSGTKLTITGDENAILKVQGGFANPPHSTKSGAGIGGEYNFLNGNIIFKGELSIDVKNIDYAAAIGTGYLESHNIDKSQVTGDITFEENVKIRAFSQKSAAIGSGIFYGGNGDMQSAKVFITDNAEIHATTRGDNCCAIGNSYGTNLGPIDISGNSKVIALNHAEYDMDKYSENSGFGEITNGGNGAAIGYQHIATKFQDDSLNMINITGNPTVIAGGMHAGIAAPNGNINISGGNVKVYSNNEVGIGFKGTARLKESEKIKGKVNISGADTVVNVSTVTIKDGKPNYSNISAGIGTGVTNNLDDNILAEVNIKDATVNVVSGRGAGIGASASNTRKNEPTKSYSKITIDNAVVNSMSYYGAGIGGGFRSNDKWDVEIKNKSKVEAISTYGGAGIGAGMGQKYYSGTTLNEEIGLAGNIVIDNSEVLAGSLHGAGIGGGNLNEYDAQGKPAGNQTPRNTDTEGTLIILNNADVKAYSRAYFSETGEKSYSYRDAITAKLLPGSMKVMASHTFAPEVERKDEMAVQSFEKDSGKLVAEIKLPKNIRSYAYSIPNGTGDVYIEKAIESNGDSFKIGQYENKDKGISYREAGRHPSLSSFNSVTEYKGASEEVLNDNTFVFKNTNFNVIYDGNGHTSGNVPEDTKEYTKGNEVIVLDKNNLIKEGYTFISWNTDPNLTGERYNPNDKFIIKQDTILYAQWKENNIPVDPGTPTEPGIPIEPSTPVTPEPKPDTKPELNKDDHFAYMIGYKGGIFKPNENITRAEAVTIFFRMLTEESRKEFWSIENNFTDVKNNSWYNNAVSTMLNAKVISMDSKGNFRPNESMTRAEFAVMLTKFFNDNATSKHQFTDIKDYWAEKEIARVAEKGWIDGYADKTFRPDQPITRAETVKLVNKILDRTPDINKLLPNMIEFNDNKDKSKWYYLEIQEATNSHKYERKDEKSLETWTELLPIRDWTALEKEWSKVNSSNNPGEVR